MKDIDESKAPLLDHLIELRKRLLLSLAVLVVLFVTSLYFAKTIFAFLVQPLLAAGQGKVIFTDVFEAFFVDVKVALFTALMVGFPFFAVQLWKFVAPGLYAREKRALLPFLLLTPVFSSAARPSLIIWQCPGPCTSCSATRAMSAGSSARRCPGSAIT